MKASHLIALSMVVSGLAQADIPRIFPTPQINKLQDKYTTIKSLKKIYSDKKGNPQIWKKLPKKEGAYALDISGDTLSIYAGDDVGFFYARQTIIQLLSESGGEKYLYAQKDPFQQYRGDALFDLVEGKSLPTGVIIDWPDLPYRGSVEGYYGAPWSHAARKSQFEFYGRNKLNTYIWAPKDDPYHHGWKSYEPYPAEVAEEIRELCAVAKENHVKFVWAVHPANTVNWSKDGGKYDLDRLVKKLELMYELGVRDFGVFIDDSNGEINKAERQVALCNYIQENFIAKKDDVGPIIMCPTGYNRAWANQNYLKTLGEGLDKSNHIMWTGNTVCHDITLEGQEWVKGTLGRPTFIWWNWPVHDYCTAHLPMGRTYGLAQDPKMIELMTGFVSNPMALPEASKTALFGVSDYTWNIMDFDSMTNWKEGMKRIYPQSHAAMQTFANHSSDLGNNVHGYRREESVEIAPMVKVLRDSIKAGHVDSEALKVVSEEFAALKDAAIILSDAPDTKLVVPEIQPWLDLAVELGEMGEAASFALTSPTIDNFGKIQDMWDKYNEGAPNRTQHSPRVVGWTELRPLIQQMVDSIQANVYQQLSQREQPLTMNPIFTASTGNPKANSEKLFDNTDASFWESAAQQRKGHWYALDFGTSIPINSIHLNMGGSRPEDFIASGQFEYSNDGKKWIALGEITRGSNIHMDLKKAGKTIEVRHIRYTSLEDKENWLAITTFDVNRSATPHLVTDVAGWENLNVARQQNKFFGAARNFEVKSMKPGESVSMVLPTPVAATWMEINFENPALASWADVTLTLEDGTTMKPQARMEGLNLVARPEQLPKKRVAKMTLTNKSKSAQDVKMNMFKLDCPPLDPRDSVDAMQDNDLLTYFDASRGVRETITAPMNAKTALIVGTNIKVKGAKTVHERIQSIPIQKAGQLLIESPAQKDARIFEVIFLEK